MNTSAALRTRLINKNCKSPETKRVIITRNAIFTDGPTEHDPQVAFGKIELLSRMEDSDAQCSKSYCFHFAHYKRYNDSFKEIIRLKRLKNDLSVLVYNLKFV